MQLFAKFKFCEGGSILRWLLTSLILLIHKEHWISLVCISGHTCKCSEDRRHLVFYKQKRGCPWINNCDVAEIWLNQHENDSANLDHIGRPNMRWAFVRFFNVEIKVVLDRQPLFRTGPLPGNSILPKAAQ